MLRRYSFALRPGWILLHVFTIALVVTMILLGRWQLHVSEAKHFSLQNAGYTVQWWLFSAFALFFWWRIMRDSAQRREQQARGQGAADALQGARSAEPDAAAGEPVAYRRYVMPTAPQQTDDPVHAAYNDYLAQLAARDAARPARGASRSTAEEAQ